jgi:SAM-dependent methyltransferase
MSEAGELENKVRLNIGCGKRKRDGFINIDICSYCDPDMVINLDDGLKEFEDSSVDEIRAEHVLEHVDDLEFVLKEMYRVSKPGAIWAVYVPHYSYGFAHPFHKRGFSRFTFDFFDLDPQRTYCGAMGFDVEGFRFNYTRSTSGVPFFLGKVISFLANLSPGFCERIWCYIVGGFEEIYFQVRVKKTSNQERKTGL